MNQTFRLRWHATLAVLACAIMLIASCSEIWGQDWSPLPIIRSSRDEYAAALKQYDQGKVMVLYFTAEWCVPCQKVKPLIPRLKRLGHLVTVDIDRDKWAVGNMGQKGIPQIAIYYKVGNQEVRLEWVGVPEIMNRLEQFERTGLYQQGTARIQEAPRVISSRVIESYIVPGPVEYYPAWGHTPQSFQGRAISGYPQANCGPSG